LGNDYSKDKINELATNSKNKNIRDLYIGINEFEKGYQTTNKNNVMKDENSDLLGDSHNILNKWNNNLCQLLNVHNISIVRQIDVHTAELLIPGPSHLAVETAIAKLKKYKLLSSDQIPEKLIQVGGETILSMIHKLINSIWIKKGEESVIVPVHKISDKTDCNNYCGISLLSTLYKNSCTRPSVAVAPSGATEENEERGSPRFKYV
jgi:hypothetical protein